VIFFPNLTDQPSWYVTAEPGPSTWLGLETDHQVPEPRMSVLRGMQMNIHLYTWDAEAYTSAFQLLDGEPKLCL
jgi:hypothetical protein